MLVKARTAREPRRRSAGLLVTGRSGTVAAMPRLAQVGADRRAELYALVGEYPHRPTARGRSRPGWPGGGGCRLRSIVRSSNMRAVVEVRRRSARPHNGRTRGHHREPDGSLSAGPAPGPADSMIHLVPCARRRSRPPCGRADRAACLNDCTHARVRPRTDLGVPRHLRGPAHRSALGGRPVRLLTDQGYQLRVPFRAYQRQHAASPRPSSTSAVTSCRPILRHGHTRPGRPPAFDPVDLPAGRPPVERPASTGPKQSTTPSLTRHCSSVRPCLFTTAMIKPDHQTSSL